MAKYDRDLLFVYQTSSNGIVVFYAEGVAKYNAINPVVIRILKQPTTLVVGDSRPKIPLAILRPPTDSEYAIITQGTTMTIPLIL